MMATLQAPAPVHGRNAHASTAPTDRLQALTPASTGDHRAPPVPLGFHFVRLMSTSRRGGRVALRAEGSSARSLAAETQPLGKRCDDHRTFPARARRPRLQMVTMHSGSLAVNDGTHT